MNIELNLEDGRYCRTGFFAPVLFSRFSKNRENKTAQKLNIPNEKEQINGNHEKNTAEKSRCEKYPFYSRL